MRVLVTRPLDDVGPLVEALRARGHEAMVEPMLQIERRAGVPQPLPLDGVQALVFTSANGVRAFADLATVRDLPVFAVGDASAEAAREAGFATVHSAGGDVADLARLVRAHLDPSQGDLFHPAASQLAGDLQGALEDAGFTLRRVALYEAQPAVDLSPTLRHALANGDLDAAVFFSPRTARTFVGLVEQAGLAGPCARLHAICLSDAVAARLAPIAWAHTWVAARPEQAALLAQLDEAAAAGSGNARETRPLTSDATAAAHDIIAAFGGIRPMASKLGVAVSTVQGWRERGSIPAARHAQIQAAADSHNIRLDAEALSVSDQGGDMTTPADAKSADAKPATGPMTASAIPATSTAGTPSAKSATAKITQARPSASGPADAATDTATDAALARAPAGRLWAGFALGVVAVAVGVGLAIVGRDLWLTPPPGDQVATVAGLESRLATVESEVRAVSAADPQAGNAAVAQFEATLSTLQAGLDGLSQELAAVASRGTDTATGEQQAAALRETEQRLRGEIAALGGRLEAVDARATNLQGRLEAVTVATRGGQAATAGETALTLAVLQLRDAMRGAAPFAAELQAVLDVAKSPAISNGADLAAAVAPLAPYANTGVPTLAKLKADFPDLARAVAAQGQGAGDEDWLAGIKRRVSGLISVRPIGPVQGDSPAAIAARAEAALANDDLTGAMRELAALQGPSAVAAQPWLAGATSRLAARTALNDLSRGLIARLGSDTE